MPGGVNCTWSIYVKSWGKALGLPFFGYMSQEQQPRVLVDKKGNVNFFLPTSLDRQPQEVFSLQFAEMLWEYGRLLKDPLLGLRLSRRFHFLEGALPT